MNHQTLSPFPTRTYEFTDNFGRFIEKYPHHENEIREIVKALSLVEDSTLREKARAHINLELGVLLLKDEETVGAFLKILSVPLV